jgi:hypothetical protein
VGRGNGAETADAAAVVQPKLTLTEQAISACLEESGLWVDYWTLLGDANHFLQFRMNKPKAPRERVEKSVEKMLQRGLLVKRTRNRIGSDETVEEYNLPQSDPANDYISFREISDSVGMQSQYASRYLNGSLGSTNLGEGIRYLGDTAEYHDLKIHLEDAPTFCERLRAHRASLGLLPG